MMVRSLSCSCFSSLIRLNLFVDLIQSIKTFVDDSIRITPIYIDIYSSRHLEHYLQQRQNDVQSKFSPIINQTIPSANGVLDKESQSSADESLRSESVTLKTTTTTENIQLLPEENDLLVESSELVDDALEIERSLAADDLLEEDENEFQGSDDDLHDLTSEFDNEDLFLDEFVDKNGDMEFLRSAAKNLMSSLAEMEAASTNMSTLDAPHSLLYGDDYVVTIKSRRFALAFLDYTQFRVEKQRNPDKFRLLATLKKNGNVQKKRTEHCCQDETPSPTIQSDLLPPMIEIKSNKKKRNRRAKKNKVRPTEKTEPTPESINGEDEQEEDDDDDNTIHILNDQGFHPNHITDQRLPHVYLDSDFKPCIVVTGEEHHDENEHDSGDHGDWHNIVAGGKPVPIPKKSKKKKQQQPKEEKAKVEPTEQVLIFFSSSLIPSFF